MTSLDAKQEPALSAKANRALVDIGRVLSREPLLSVAFDRVVGIVGTVVPTDRVVITSYDPIGRSLVDVHVSGIETPGRVSGGVVPFEGTVSGYVVSHPETLVLRASNTEEILRLVPDMKVVIDAGLKSGVSCVLRSQERQVGILHVRSFGPETYGESEVAFIEAVADMIAGSLASEQLRNELERKAAQEAVLAEIGQTISSSLDVGEVYQQFAMQVAKLVQFNRLVISLVDEERDELVDEYVSGVETQGLMANTRHPLVSSQNYVAMKTAQSISFDQTALMQRANEHEPTRIALTAGLNSMLITPLIWRDYAIGTLNFRSKRSDGYGAAEIKLAEAVSAQISGAIENTRLYADAERVARVRSGVATIGRIVNSSVSYQDAFEKFVVAARELLPFDRVVISLPSTRGDTFVDAYVFGTPVPGHELGARIPTVNSIFDPESLPHDPVVKTAADLNEFNVVGSPEEPFVKVGLISRLLVPLMWTDQMVGTLSLRSKLPAAYGENEQNVAVEIAAQISGVIATSRLHDETARIASVREGLAEIGRVVSSSISIEDAYAQFAQEAQKIFPLDRVSVMLLPPGSEIIEVAYVYGVPMDETVAGDYRPVADSSRRSVFFDGDTVVTDEAETTLEAKNYLVQKRALDAGLLSRLTTPLKWQGSIIGCLDFRSTKSAPYGDEEVETAKAIAAQISGAVQTSRLYKETREASAVRSGLVRIGQIINSSVSIAEIFDDFAEEARKIIPFDRVSIALRLPDSESFITSFASGVEIPEQPVGQVFQVNTTSRPELYKHQKAVISNEEATRKEAETFDIQRQCLEVGLLSRLVIPLVWQNDVIGSMHLRSREPDPYAEDEVRVAEAIAAQISGAVQTSRLYEQQRREAQVQEALASVTAAASSGLEQGEVFSSLADELRALIPYDRFSISLLDPRDRKILTLAYVRGVEVDGLGVGDFPSHPDGVGKQWRWRTVPSSSPVSEILIGKFDESDRKSELRSRIEAPLGVSDDDFIGYIGMRRGGAYEYTQRDLEILTRVAGHITPSIKNIRLHLALAKEANERELLAEVGRVIGDAASISEMFDNFKPLAAQLVPTDAVGLALVDDEANSLYVVETDSTQEIEMVERGSRLLLRPSLSGEAIDNGGTVVFTPSKREEILARSPSILPLYDIGSRSFMATPIISRREVIGMLLFQARAESAYDQSHAELADRLARQIAGKLESAGFQEQIKHEARVNELLAEIGRAVNSAGSVPEMFNAMKDQARELLPIDGIAIVILDREDGKIRIAEVDAGPIREQGEAAGREVPLEGTIANAACEELRPILVCPPEGTNPFDSYPGLKTLHGIGARSFLAAPLISQGKALGALVMFSLKYEALDWQDALLAERVAGQMAGLIETFSLQERLSEEAKTNQLMADIGRLVNSSQNVHGMFAATKQIVRDLIPSDGIGLSLVDWDSETYRIVDADVGDLGSERDAALGEPRPLAGSFTLAIGSSGKPVLCTPELGDDLIERYPGLRSIHKSGGRSLVGAPIISQGRTLGALIVYSKQLKAYKDNHAILLERVANQMAGMIETAQLLEEVLKLANTVDASPEFVALTDADMQIQYINKAGRDLLGVVKDGAIPDGLTGYDLFDTEGAQVFRDIGVPQAQDFGFWWGEPRAVRIDGAEFPVEALLVPIHSDSSSGGVIAYSIQYRDISKRLQAQEALVESEERYRDLFDNADELIQSADADGTLRYVNKAWLSRLGYTSEESVGLTVWDVIHPDSIDHCRNFFGRIMAGESPGEVEAIFKTKSGEPVYVRGTANARFENGIATSTRGIYRDISARIALEKIKDEFVSVVSHELRTPLTSLRGSLGLLAGGVLADQPEKASRMLEVAVSNTERLVRLINDILDVERIESGRATMKVELCNVSDLLDQATGEMSSLAEVGGVTLRVESPRDLTMPVDRDRMIQTLANLLSNAIKFSSGGGEVTVRAYSGDDRVTIEVQDQGRGIPTDKLETVFERFQQVDASDSREMGGTGLGLTISKSIVEQHGGTISVASIEGQGCTFTFWIPMVSIQSSGPDLMFNLPVSTT
ncbi:MAG: GAF domain-containing protein [Chloroflexi bacterium]|nr:GAF domain-containing protein [Chloroflexota bacterium]